MVSGTDKGNDMEPKKQLTRAEKLVEETLTSTAAKPIPTSPSSPQADPDDDLALAAMSPEQRLSKRLEKRPSTDHLQAGTAFGPDGARLALFDIGSRIVVERHQDGSWLDTRTYRVKDIDDETGVCRCIDELADHNAFVGFKSPQQWFFLAPERGDPFSVGKPTKVRRTRVTKKRTKRQGSRG